MLIVYLSDYNRLRKYYNHSQMKYRNSFKTKCTCDFEILVEYYYNNDDEYSIFTYRLNNECECESE